MFFAQIVVYFLLYVCGRVSCYECFKEETNCWDSMHYTCQTQGAYQGTRNITVLGHPCQIQTSSQSSQNRNSRTYLHNYCRIPDASQQDETSIPKCHILNLNSGFSTQEHCFHYCENPECYAEYEDGLCYRERQPSCRQATSYLGTRSTTVNNRTCQRWSSQLPHPHNFANLGDHNYCRNPDNSSSAWCFTTDPGVKKEYCFPLCQDICHNKNDNCWNAHLAVCEKSGIYFGNISTTVRGTVCDSWANTKLNTHFYAHSEDQNFCRWDYCFNACERKRMTVISTARIEFQAQQETEIKITKDGQESKPRGLVAAVSCLTLCVIALTLLVAYQYYRSRIPGFFKHHFDFFGSARYKNDDTQALDV